MEFPQLSYESLCSLPSQGVTGSKSTKTLLLCLLGRKGSSWTFLLGWPSFPGLYTPCIQLPRWVIACSSSSLPLLPLVSPSQHFLLGCLTSGWTDLLGGTLLCTGWSFSQQACGCTLGEGTADKLTKACMPCKQGVNSTWGLQPSLTSEPGCPAAFLSASNSVVSFLPWKSSQISSGLSLKNKLSEKGLIYTRDCCPWFGSLMCSGWRYASIPKHMFPLIEGALLRLRNEILTSIKRSCYSLR